MIETSTPDPIEISDDNASALRVIKYIEALDVRMKDAGIDHEIRLKLTALLLDVEAAKAVSTSTADRSEDADAHLAPMKWEARLLAAHPRSEPEYWPADLKLKYMETELLALRSLVGGQKSDPEHVPRT